MKNIDIIKAAQHVDDKFINEAIDFAPIPKRSFKWIYPVAACAAVAIIAVPVIARQRFNTTPGYSGSSSDPQVSNSSNSPSRPSIEIDVTSCGTTPFIADTKLADDTPRTFYNVATEEPAKKIDIAEFGRVHLTDALTECIAKPHDPQDLFAVRLDEYSNNPDMDIKTIDKYFAHTYDRNIWFVETNGEGALYMTEEEIKNLEIPSDMAIVLDLAYKQYRKEIVDSDYLKTVRTNKVYATVKLKRGTDEATGTVYAPPEEEQDGHRVVTPEGSAAMKSYMDEFAQEFGIINYKLLFRGNVSYENASFSGELETEVVEKLLSDDRVESITCSNGGGYVYESYGYFANAVKVTEKQMEKLPAGLNYYEITDILGNTAAFGNSKTRYYVTENAELIILKYDSRSDICPLSGKELYDSAVPLYYTGELPDTVDSDMTFGILGQSGLIIRLGSDGYLDAGYVCQAPEGCELIHEDGTPADDDELNQIGGRAFIKCDLQLETYPPQLQCTEVVLLDD